MKMAEFRSNQKLVTWADKVMAHPNWRILMDVMQDEHPMLSKQNQQVVGEEHWDSKLLGEINGYNEFKELLEKAKVPLLFGREPEPVYEPPEAINK